MEDSIKEMHRLLATDKSGEKDLTTVHPEHMIPERDTEHFAACSPGNA